MSAGSRRFKMFFLLSFHQNCNVILLAVWVQVHKLCFIIKDERITRCNSYVLRMTMAWVKMNDDDDGHHGKTTAITTFSDNISHFNYTRIGSILCSFRVHILETEMGSWLHITVCISTFLLFTSSNKTAQN